MKSSAGKVAVMMVAVGVALGGCATRESVRNAQGAADAADRHAGVAQGRAEEAYGVGNNALTVGNNALGVGNSALTSAQEANQKAELNSSEVNRLKRKVAYLEWKVLPHKKVKHRRHRAPAAAQVQLKDRNS